MSGKCEAEIISLEQGNWNPLLGENVLGADACIDHLPLKRGIDDGCTCVTFFWDSDVQKTVLNKNKIAAEMIARIVLLYQVEMFHCRCGHSCNSGLTVRQFVCEIWTTPHVSVCAPLL